MSFQPIIPQSGLVGWRFLQRSYDIQIKAFEKSPQLIRDTDYFKARIGSVSTAEELVADRRLLRVALGAFGLQDDINNRFLIRRILEGGVSQQNALANRLGDDRYRDMTRSFGFGDLAVPNTKLSDFAQTITARYRQQQFELSVGTQSEGLRLALNATRELAELAASPEAERTKWFRMMGRPPLREVFQTALGLPKSFGALDLDRQLAVFQDRAQSQLGLNSFNDLSDPAMADRVIQRFLQRSDAVQQNTTSGSAVALTLLSSARRNQ